MPSKPQLQRLDEYLTSHEFRSVRDIEKNLGAELFCHVSADVGSVVWGVVCPDDDGLLRYIFFAYALLRVL